MLRINLFSRLLNSEICSERFFNRFKDFNDSKVILATTDFAGAHGRFRSATRTTAGTTAVVTPPISGSIIVTDLLISGEKQASSTAEVRFTDGSNTATLFLASQVDAPPAFAHTFRGRVQGWKDARIDMITSGAGDATVTICYVKVPTGLVFAEWNALR